MAGLSVRDVFWRGFVRQNDLVNVPIIPPEEERRLFRRFDVNIHHRNLGITRDQDLDGAIRLAYIAYHLWSIRWGQEPNQVFHSFVRFLALEIERLYNQTPQGIQVAIRRNRIIQITRDIIINISRITLIEVHSSIRIQATFRGFATRIRNRRLLHQQNMTLAGAQARTAVALRDALKTEPFFGNSHDELISFLSQVNSMMELNGYVHNIANVNAGNAGGWLLEYRREVLAISLNFRGQVAMWWATNRFSDANQGRYTPYTWNDDTYTHPDNNAGGAILYRGLNTLLANQFRDSAPLAEPNYKSIDWSPVKFSGRSGEVALLIQTVRAIATQHNLPWNPHENQELPAQHGFAIVAGIASRFTGSAADWWSQLPNKPTQIEVVAVAPLDNNGLLNRIRKDFRSLTHSIDHLRKLQSMKWDEKQPLVEFNVEFDYTLREADQLGTDQNILIDYYCNTLPSSLAMPIRDTLDSYAVVNPLAVSLANTMKLAIQKNSTLALNRTSRNTEKKCSKCGNTGHTAQECKMKSAVLEAVGNNS